jgi:tetratricopeptide (TPR) repeat protein
MRPTKGGVCASLAVAAFLAAAGALHADIVSMKDGGVLECKIIEQTVKNGRQVMVVELEGGKRQDIAADEIAWIAKAKPSWEVRKENEEWYRKEVDRKGDKLTESWKENETLGKTCRRKKMDKEAEVHFRKAYELRIAEAKDTIKEHENIASWLERICGLFDLASDEWAWVYKKKIEEAHAGEKELTDSNYVTLGKWAEGKSLYDEAQECYEKAVEINPKNTIAAKGIEKIKQLRETLVNPKLFRTVKAEHKASVDFFQGKQSGDGSFGSDVSEAGVQGLRGQSGLCTIALLGQWEFEAADNPDTLKKVPEPLRKGIEYLLGAPVNQKKLRGPDLWGNIWTIHAMVRVLQQKNLKTYHDRAKSKITECIGALVENQGPDGGWMYYDFAKSTGASFTGAALLIGLVLAKQEGVQINEQLFQRGLDHLQKMKQSDGVWMYRTSVPQKVEGSQGRAGVCELALYMCGKGSKAALQVAVENFFKYRHILEAVKGKKGTHMGTGGTAPYYFLYGHLWLAQAIKKLDAGARDSYLSRLRDLLLKDREDNNSFSDWPLTKSHDIYGSAMGAITLYHIGTIDPEGTGRKR